MTQTDLEDGAVRILYMGIGDTPTSRALPQSWPDRVFGRHVGRHEVVTFGYAEGLDVVVDPGACLQDVLDALPADFVPDVCVCTHVDYLLMPRGMENAPFPTVAITADWDFRGGIARSVAQAFDLVVTLGEESANALRRLGARHVLPYAYFGVPEQDLEESVQDAGRERTIDVLFTGTINDHTHLDRSRWLQRLAKLSDRYKIVIGPCSAAPGAYRELLQKTKLVFTFHRRGELQMRFTDAATQGAVVLDNGVETAAYYRAGVEYAAYDESNLEQKIAELLADETKRAGMAEAARQRTVQEFGTVQRFAVLFDALEVELRSSGSALGARPAAALPPAERARRFAEHLYVSHFDTCMGTSTSYLKVAEEALRDHPQDVRCRHDLAVVMCAGGDARGIEMLAQLVAKQPLSANAHFSLGCMQRAAGRFPEARHHLAVAEGLLQSGGGEFDPWLLLPRSAKPEYRSLLKSYCDSLAKLVAGDVDAPSRVLAAECAYALAELEHERGHIEAAYECAKRALAQDEARGEFACMAAMAAELLGDDEHADRYYDRVRDLLPFDFGWRLRELSYRARVGQFERARQLLVAAIGLCRGAPPHDSHVQKLRRLTTVVQQSLAGEPVKAAILRYQFAAAALDDLCAHHDKHPTQQVAARVEQLLLALGDGQAAADWRGAQPAEASANVATSVVHPRLPGARR
ncbi:MAG: glycosyltransferase [Planctomycetota bacterium]